MYLKTVLAAPLLSISLFSASPAFASSLSFDKDIPQQLSSKQTKKYTEIFRAIQQEDWKGASEKIAKASDGPLKHIAKAELYLAANSPRVELGPLLTLLNEAPHIPHAEQLGRLASRRGAEILPDRPQRQNLSFIRGSVPRSKPGSIKSDSTANRVSSDIIAYIKADNPAAAEARLDDVSANMSREARTEWQQRVAWSYYIENQDAKALKLANKARTGSGRWSVHADWVAGLAAWRLGDCSQSGAAFSQVGKNAGNREMKAAGYFWAARSHVACRVPQLSQLKLQAAARYGDSFYGILAAEALGMQNPVQIPLPDFKKSDWRGLKKLPNVRAAISLAEIGQISLADELLRHQARIGDRNDHEALIKLARELNLPRTQLWLGHHAPSGIRPATDTRFPTPKWVPEGGWRVDPALIYAHTLQESGFRTNVTSPAGARGLMQVLPGTARGIARSKGQNFQQSQLFHPQTNLEYGQSYLEQLRGMSATQGLLPKIIAAYNAGPTPIARWNTEIKDGGDPLLYMESIPYVETRAYVSIILRNYWIYGQLNNEKPRSLTELAQHSWPRFPKERRSKKPQFTQR